MLPKFDLLVQNWPDVAAEACKFYRTFDLPSGTRTGQ